MGLKKEKVYKNITVDHYDILNITYSFENEELEFIVATYKDLETKEGNFTDYVETKHYLFEGIDNYPNNYNQLLGILLTHPDFDGATEE